MRHRGRFYILVLSLLGCVYLGGCFSSTEEIYKQSPQSWTKRDCLTVVVSAIAHNLYDHRNNIKVIATPYVPRVTEALTRLAQLRDSVNIDSAEFGKQNDALLRASTGLLYDWEKGLPFSAAHQRYYQSITDLDSLLFMITLINHGWPCQPPTVVSGGGTRPLMPVSEWPCYTPSLESLQDEILFINEQADTIKPRYVWGVKNKELTTDETLFVMFTLSDSSHAHFLEQSRTMTLIIKTFAPSIGYRIPVAELMGH